MNGLRLPLARSGKSKRTQWRIKGRAEMAPCQRGTLSLLISRRYRVQSVCFSILASPGDTVSSWFLAFGDRYRNVLINAVKFCSVTQKVQLIRKESWSTFVQTEKQCTLMPGHSYPPQITFRYCKS